MHNPNRHAPNRALHQRRQPPPGAGITHASIMKKHAGPSSVPAGDRKPTELGFSIALFEGEAFATRFEVIRARCTTGRMVNRSDDRSFYVAAGTIFATTFPDGEEAVTVKLHHGTFFNAPKGVTYAIATTMEPAELYISESLLYHLHVEQLSPSEQGTVGVDEEFVESNPVTPTAVNRVQNPRAVEYQIEQAKAATARRERNKQPGVGLNANAANVATIGVSPMPSGPPRED